jgi:predicted metal-dependent hydrolase
MKSSLYSLQELRRRTFMWALTLRVNPRIVRVQSMRKKWGSCSSRGIVTLARDLAEQDGAFQDFVIAHELLHLRVPNHGKLFKALMSAYIPRWRVFEAANRESRVVSTPVERQKLISRLSDGSLLQRRTG